MGFTLHAVPTLRADLPTELSHSDKRSVRTHVPTKRYVSRQAKRDIELEPYLVFPPRPFRNGLKCTWQARMIFSLLWSVSEGVMVKTQTTYAFDLINNCRVQAAHGNISHRKASSPKTRCNPWIPKTLMDGYMGFDQARNRVKYRRE
jgi:hypothetical protein